MIKKMLIGMLLVVPCVQADWIDDLAAIVDDGQLGQQRAEQIIKGYVEQDEKEIARLEKKAETNDEDGFWAWTRAASYQGQWATTKASLRYHTKVYEFIKELPNNDRDRKNLIEHLENLNKNRQELKQLKEQYAESSGWKGTIKAGSLVAAKELHIKGRKALIKSKFII